MRVEVAASHTTSEDWARGQALDLVRRALELGNLRTKPFLVVGDSNIKDMETIRPAFASAAGCNFFTDFSIVVHSFEVIWLAAALRANFTKTQIIVLGKDR